MAHADLVRDGVNVLALDELDATTLIANQLDALVVCDDVGRHRLGTTTAYCLPHIAEWEQAVADWIHDANATNDPLLDEVTVLAQLPAHMNEQQNLAALSAFTHRASVITGGAGVGKTFTIATIVRIATHAGFSVAMAAPTGKAAQRMAEQVGKAGCDIEAMTTIASCSIALLRAGSVTRTTRSMLILSLSMKHP
jgi:exodeoxyribonuclease V alpha subunit